ncbi:unnamed protein product [Rotaria sp. Silwood2]|nr:unnamed protein product [Rotaria sp. Silwood2]
MNIDTSDVDSGDQDPSTSNTCSNTSNADRQVKEPSGIQFDIGDDDDTNEFQAMFMSNATLPKSHPNCCSTPLVDLDKINRKSTVCAATEYASSYQTKKSTHRRPLSTINGDHQSTTTNLNIQNFNTLTNLRVSTNLSPAAQVSIRNQSLSSINYTTNNNAILDTFVEYRNLRRDLQRVEQKIENWKTDYEALKRQLEKLQKTSFPRQNADGRAFSKHLLESLNSCEQDKDNRTSAQIAKSIGMPETILLSCSAVDPQKTALHVFNQVFPDNDKKEALINIDNLNVNYPILLKDILGQQLPVHDLDFKRWALRIAKERSLNDFPASYDWVGNFKRRHSVCSRKITKFVTTRQVENQDLINQSADSFVAETSKIFQKYDDDNILNTNQIGIELELHSNRALSYQGEKTTIASVYVQSVQQHTHILFNKQSILVGT